MMARLDKLEVSDDVAAPVVYQRSERSEEAEAQEARSIEK
jgi:hypothetical protein